MKQFKKARLPIALLAVIASSIAALNHSCSNESAASIPAGAKSFPVADYTAYDANGEKVGTVMFVDWPNTAIKLPDGTMGQFHTATGLFSTGICETGNCMQRAAEIAKFGGGAGVNRDIADHGYCGYTSGNCSGTCYVNSKPIANSLFRGASGFLLASGSETSAGVVVTNSSYRHDFADCIASGGTFTNGYPVTTAHTLDSSVTYPFATPMYFIKE